MANLRVDKITSTETFEKTGSVQFDGTDDHLDVGSAGDFNYLHNGAASFTAEFWVYPQLVNSRQIIFSTGGNSDTTGFVIRIMSSGSGGSSNGYFVSAQTSKSSSGNYLYWDSDPTKLDANTWYHIATVYDHTDNTLKIYVDGKLTNSGVSRTQGTFGSHSTSNSTHSLHIGEEPFNNSKDLKGHLSNLRILNGVKLYTANFKPPMRELEVVPGTVLLACQSKTDATLEKTGKTITANGNAVACELTPGLLTPIVKSGGGSAITGSVEFSGSTDYLTVPNTEDLRLADSDFTIEFWATISKVDSSYTAFALFENSSALRSYLLEVRSNGAVRFEWWYNGSSSNNITTGTGVIAVNQWNHYAVSRNGATLKLFINGVEVGSSNVGTNSFFNNTATAFMIGGMFQSAVHTQKWQGNISNFRINKGTALYTDNFIPPTRELKKVPGTVLLCCQDPDNPLTEATGKTITPYGDLGRTPGEYITFNRTFDSNINGWEGYNSTPSYDTGRLKIDASTEYDGAQTQNTVAVQSNRKYILRVTVELGTAGGVRIQPRVSDNSAALATLDVTADGIYEVSFNSNAETGVHIRLITSGGNTGTAFFDDVSITNATEDKAASSFTPQVGDDRQVTFEGVTKINSDAYFYLPTGDTVTRDSRSGRGLFGGAMTPSFNDTIDLINIPTMGNAVDFGDIFTGRYTGACSSSTRAVFGGGEDPSGVTNVMDFVTIATNSDAINFGDLTEDRRQTAGCSSSTRGLFGGGSDPTNLDVIDYVTIASIGDAVDFGNLTVARRGVMSCSSPVRGVWGGGIAPGPTLDEIDYVTIASTGNALDFGNLSTDRRNIASGGCSNQVRGVFAGGRRSPANANSDIIDYITIASTGNAQDFGDLSETKSGVGACSSLIRGVFAGGYTPTILNTLEYITIASTGDAQDFGDLTIAAHSRAGCSDSHGGLG